MLSLKSDKPFSNSKLNFDNYGLSIAEFSESLESMLCFEAF
jgi:hypothetical protein